MNFIQTYGFFDISEKKRYIQLYNRYNLKTSKVNNLKYRYVRFYKDFMCYKSSMIIIDDDK